MAAIILPNHLFPEPVDEEEKYLVEHPHFFSRLSFHRQKLVLHRASMKAYQEETGAEYIEHDEDFEFIFEQHEHIKMYDPVDHTLRDEIEGLADEKDVELEFVESPMFMNSMEFNSQAMPQNYFHLEYYKQVRKHHGILIDNDGNPEGGKWSFDPENREKMPEDEQPPEIPQFSSEHVEEAKKYVEKNFPDNPGSLENFSWPTTRDQALENLEDFLENRLENFGDYQDAIDSDLRYGYHSLLSPALNIGLLTPGEVVEKTLAYHERRDYPMNSLEGFLRQVIGWREFIRAVYEMEPEMQDENFFGCDNPLPEEFYTAGTGLPPVDTSIENALEDGYCHHIERLMVLGNVMLLLEVDPDEVYEWFSEMFIDSYDWVMVPNVYGMSQYSWENMMTKPYISSSNYIRKMSHYPSGEWEDYWDGLYWSFIEDHRDKIEDIQRMSFMASQLDRMSDDTLEEHRQNAEEFRESLGL
ncbi:MAG: cryptochrome/photolyase family protein [Candidatus Nanohaloarchaea archaeon]